MAGPAQPYRTRTKPGLPEQPKLSKSIMSNRIPVRYSIHNPLILGNTEERDIGIGHCVKENKKYLMGKPIEKTTIILLDEFSKWIRLPQLIAMPASETLKCLNSIKTW